MVKQNGFTLIEVLAALIMFAFTMAGLGRLVVTTVEANRDARRVTAATNLAMDKIETLRSAGLSLANFSSLADSTSAELLNEQGETTGSGLIYSRTWDITTDTPQLGATEIAVTVSWERKTVTNGNRDKREIVIKSIVKQP